MSCKDRVLALLSFQLSLLILPALQAGVVAAFGLVRGGAQADMIQLSATALLSPETLAQVQA